MRNGAMLCPAVPCDAMPCDAMRYENENRQFAKSRYGGGVALMPIAKAQVVREFLWLMDAE